MTPRELASRPPFAAALPISRPSCARCGTGASTGESSPHSRGRHECCTVRNTRSGCGIMMSRGRRRRAARRCRAASRSGSRDSARSTSPWLSTKRSATSAARRSARALGGANSARPSPCAVAIGMREPAMPREEDRRASRRSRPAKRAPRTARSDCARTAASARRPGSARSAPRSSGSRCRRRARRCRRARRTARTRRARAREEDRLRPALARAEHVAVGEAAARDDAAKSLEVDAAREQVASCARRAPRSRRGRAPRPSRRWLFTPCSRSTATCGRAPLRDVRRGDVVARIERQLRR